VTQAKSDTPPPWLWGMGILGLILLIGTLGLLIYEGAAGDSSPPAVVVRVETILPTGNGYLVRFRAVNQGGSTAEGVAIEGELSRGAERVQVSETTLDYMPSHSARQGGLFFTHDPRAYDLQLRATGYEQP
jgi:uncharacterized protein (TIGR02588 family)